MRTLSDEINIVRVVIRCLCTLAHTVSLESRSARRRRHHTRPTRNCHNEIKTHPVPHDMNNNHNNDNYYDDDDDSDSDYYSSSNNNNNNDNNGDNDCTNTGFELARQPADRRWPDDNSRDSSIIPLGPGAQRAVWAG